MKHIEKFVIFESGKYNSWPTEEEDRETIREICYDITDDGLFRLSMVGSIDYATVVMYGLPGNAGNFAALMISKVNLRGLSPKDPGYLDELASYDDVADVDKRLQNYFGKRYIKLTSATRDEYLGPSEFVVIFFRKN